MPSEALHQYAQCSAAASAARSCYLRHICPNNNTYVSSYYYRCVLTLLHLSPHTTALLLHLCPRTTTLRICVLALLHCSSSVTTYSALGLQHIQHYNIFSTINIFSTKYTIYSALSAALLQQSRQSIQCWQPFDGEKDREVSCMKTVDRRH